MTTVPSFNIGIEEEYQIIDPETRELRSYITEMLAAGKMVMAEQIKAWTPPQVVRRNGGAGRRKKAVKTEPTLLGIDEGNG